VQAPKGFNYLLVKLKPGESWAYEPPLAWLAVAQGGVSTNESLSAGDLAVFDPADAPISLHGRRNGRDVCFGFRCSTQLRPAYGELFSAYFGRGVGPW
jgi:hypothetical protein